LKLITLARGAVLCEAKDSMRHIWFVESGVVSLATGHPAPVVVATVGREGAVGGPTLLLGGGIAFGRYEMLMSGSTLWLDATRFHDLLREHLNFDSLCKATLRRSSHRCFKTSPAENPTPRSSGVRVGC
jgi:hypothetical protein